VTVVVLIVVVVDVFVVDVVIVDAVVDVVVVDVVVVVSSGTVVVLRSSVVVVVVVLAEVLVEAEVGICVVVLVWVVFVVAPPEVVCGSGVVTPPMHLLSSGSTSQCPWLSHSTLPIAVPLQRKRQEVPTAIEAPAG